ncbi:MAG TPA: hypothetical protein VGL07_13185 [Buttiauxella sp.]
MPVAEWISVGLVAMAVQVALPVELVLSIDAVMKDGAATTLPSSLMVVGTTTSSV